MVTNVAKKINFVCLSIGLLYNSALFSISAKGVLQKRRDEIETTLKKEDLKVNDLSEKITRHSRINDNYNYIKDCMNRVFGVKMKMDQTKVEDWINWWNGWGSKVLRELNIIRRKEDRLRELKVESAGLEEKARMLKEEAKFIDDVLKLL